MTPQELTTVKEIIDNALQNIEFINKIWIAGAAVAVSLFAAFVGAGTQILVAHWQRRTQLNLASQQEQQQKQALEEQLAMQELASRRTAIANIAAKRQVWIDELRKDMAVYLSTWQEISYRWDAIVSKPLEKSINNEYLKDFSEPVAEMRREALEIKLRIQLRLNMIEQKHKDLLGLMQKLETSTLLYQRTVSNFPSKDIQNVFKNLSQCIVLKLQEILKEEWDRIKRESYADPKENLRS
ncbi:MAG: hypothetical protein K2Y09_01690 [Nitrosomonas sp.]|uniref:hypothetical protein n=1 Tax=Nitrosomonas sp. TaxID=42353 RepID=UPI001E00CDCE|nr:hypothetical protein [Nitrosomonas sp.]MBX9893883.1 hypothetical protein [Nitrosomonas sp.]